MSLSESEHARLLCCKKYDTTLSIKKLSVTTFSITTFSITTFRMTLSIMAYLATNNIITLRITNNNNMALW